jgi:hypothetical protein
MKKTMAWTVSALLAITLAVPAAAQSTTNPLRKPAQAAPAPAAPAPATAAPAPTTKAPSSAQMAQRNKMKACGAEWQALKKAGKTQGKTWRQFSSECLKKD